MTLSFHAIAQLRSDVKAHLTTVGRGSKLGPAASRSCGSVLKKISAAIENGYIVSLEHIPKNNVGVSHRRQCRIGLYQSAPDLHARPMTRPAWAVSGLEDILYSLS